VPVLRVEEVLLEGRPRRVVRVLERAKLVRRQVRGRDHWIRFNEGPLSTARNYTDSMLKFWAARLRTLDTRIAGSEDAGND